MNTTPPPPFRGVDPFFGWGGGAKVRQMSTFSARFARKFAITFCEKLRIVIICFVVKYSVFSTYSCIRYYEFFKLPKLLGGGKTICLPGPPPQYFHWGRLPPPPPRIDASAGPPPPFPHDRKASKKLRGNISSNLSFSKKKGEKRQKKRQTERKETKKCWEHFFPL